MKPSPLSWIRSFLTLHSVASVDERPSFTDLPAEMLDVIVRKVVVSQKFDVCGYVDWLAGNRWAWSWTDVGIPMLKETAKEERNLRLHHERQRVRRQKILKSVRTFVRIRSGLPTNCMGMEAEQLKDLAGVFESSYEECASLSESSTWKKACMAGLLEHNTLIELLPHLSEDFWSHNKELLLQTAFFIGDIDSLDAITKSLGVSQEDVSSMASELEIVFSGSVDFFDALLERLPNVMEKRLELIREACSLNRLDILLGILEVANPVEPHKLDEVIDSFCRLEMVENDSVIYRPSTQSKLYHVLLVAARHGHLPIIRFLWPAMAPVPNKFEAEAAIKDMMTEAGRNNQCSVLGFLLWESGTECMQLAQKLVNDVFETTFGSGLVNVLKLLTRKDNDGTFAVPGLVMPTLSPETLRQVCRIGENWKGIKYLVGLKKDGDSRFAHFELVDRANTVLCMACRAGNYDFVDYLLCKTDGGGFVFPLTNPAAQDNQPLANACEGGNLQIVEKLMERDASGSYAYKGIDPSAQNYQTIYNACLNGKLKVLKFLLTRNDSGDYILPNMKDVNLNRALLVAIHWNRMNVVRFLLKMKDGKYALPAMEDVDLTVALSAAVEWNQMESVRFFLGQADGSYFFPGAKVTKAMLEFENQSHNMRQLLKSYLEQQRIDA